MTWPRDPTGLELAKAIYRQQYENELAFQTGDLLREMWKKIYDEMQSPQWSKLTAFQRDRQSQLFVEISRIVRSGYKSVDTMTSAELVDYSSLEQSVAQKTLRTRITANGGVLDVNTSSMLSHQLVLSVSDFPIHGLTLGEWWANAANTMSTTARRIIQQGLIAGEGTRDIASKLYSNDLEDASLMLRSQREAHAVVRTAVNAIQNDASTKTYEQAGDKVTNSYMLVSARDKRVTPICRSLDGKIFRYNDPKRKLPPFHFNCRTTTVPELNWKALGMKHPPANSPLGFKSYDSWLQRQSKAEQDAILGKAGASLWRTGKVDLSDLVTKNGQRMTLADLRNQFELDGTPKPTSKRDALSGIWSTNSRGELESPVAQALVKAWDDVKKAGAADSIMSDVQGVIPGQPMRTDRLFSAEATARQQADAKALYAASQGSRDILRRTYGDTLTLYRADVTGSQMIQNKNTLLWADRKMASRFLEPGRSLVSRTMPVEHVIAAVATDAGYREIWAYNPLSHDVAQFWRTVFDTRAP